MLAERPAGLTFLNFIYDEDVNRGLFWRVFWMVAALWYAVPGFAQKPAAKTAAGLPDCGPLTAQALRCAALGFTYKIPFGWVDRTSEMQAAPNHQGTPPDQQKEGQSGKTLLAVFERPPEAPGEGIDSAVVIAVEERSAYPQLKSAADYFGPLSDLAERRGLKMKDEPYSFSIHGRPLVRADFSGGTESAPVRQTSLVSLQKGYILSFTFLGGSEDEIDGLIENLAFTIGAKTGSPK